MDKFKSSFFKINFCFTFLKDNFISFVITNWLLVGQNSQHTHTQTQTQTQNINKSTIKVKIDSNDIIQFECFCCSTNKQQPKQTKTG